MWKLIPPRQGRTPFFYVRGVYCGIRLDRSTGTVEERAAKRILETWKKLAERGEFSRGTEPAPATFVNAVKAYLHAGGSRQYLEAIVEKWRDKASADIDQVALDTLAADLYPAAPPATRNRQVYTPVIAVLRHVGIERRFKRPKGSRGNKRTFWLRPPETFKLFEAATALDAELGILCVFLNYTGVRLGEALALETAHLDLSRQFAYVPDTKTDEPRALHLPPVVVAALANHPQGLNRAGRLFRFHHRSGDLSAMLREAARNAGIDLPRRTAFHVFRHNYGTWMRLYGGLDGLGLTRTGAWADLQSVERYSHSEAGAEAKRADDLPTPKARSA